jgi:peptidoglycan/LPS O-acetylase OafA/YrhL
MTKCPACEKKSLTLGHYCGFCGAQLEVDQNSVPWRWLTFGLAATWSLASMVVIVTFPVGDAGMTLYRQDHTILWEFALILGAVLTVGAIDLTLRTRHHSARGGGPTIVVGATLAAFSLFGWIWGLASLGVIGGLLALSARPFDLRAVPVSRQPATSHDQ